ncbi:DUF6925 family protein [Tritonibacter mobilis]|uniref:DUF6925 family protein n=1 Tax=Tritonibacter mobilis TaxID=379347 RepID=UPI0039A62BD1
MPELHETLKAALQDAETGWNMGSFGAIAEFHHVASDLAPIAKEGLEQFTDRGGIRIEHLEGVRPVAYETLSPKPHRWSQAVALCLPEVEAAMSRRTVLTDLGPDEGAIREEDRAAHLFDMGLAQPQVDFCIRTADPDLIALLQAEVGRSLFEQDNPAMGAILKAHPHRVALTRIGRVEVYQMIGGPDTGGKSPEGPHTHVLPKLLRAERTHSANTPIPEGWVPCGYMHPENPVIGRLGEDKALNRAAYDAFQTLLGAWGAEQYMEGKAALTRCIERSVPAEDAIEPGTREGRSGWRNALRQMRVVQGKNALLETYVARFDRDGAFADEENPGH